MFNIFFGLGPMLLPLQRIICSISAKPITISSCLWHMVFNWTKRSYVIPVVDLIWLDKDLLLLVVTRK